MDLQIIENEFTQINLFIDKKNGLICKNFITFLKFFNYFKSFNTSDFQILINKSPLDEKNCRILDFTNYSSIKQEFTLAKKSLMGEYIVDYLNNTFDSQHILYEIEEKILNLEIDNVLLESKQLDLYKMLDYLVKSSMDCNNNLQSIELITKKYIQDHPEKIFIIFVKTFEVNIELENVIIFNLDSFENNNIILGKDIVNLDIPLLIKHLELNFDTFISEEELLKLFYENQYALFFNLNDKNLQDTKLKQMKKLINEIFSL